MTVDHTELRALAAKGHTAARMELVQWLVSSEVEKEREEGIAILLAACEAGSTAALMQHAALAALGVGRTQDFRDAISLVSQAAALGDASAEAQLRSLGGRIQHSVWSAPIVQRQHHAAPRIFTVEGFLPTAVCQYFIDYSQNRLEPTLVRDGMTGVDMTSVGRSATMSGAGALAPDLIVQLTNLRIAEAVQVPVTHQEPTTFLRYGPGQEYQAHYDLIRPDEELMAAEELRTLGQRVATVLVYLNEGYEAGETFFPHLNWGFKGKTGDALIFWNMSITGERERLSLHAGLPVKSGVKWLLSKWVRAKPVPLI